MVRAGLAEVYRGRPPKGFDSTPYRQAEVRARGAKREMWVLGNKYVSPRGWRRKHRKM
jgi:endonuclease YncB( thermonuclease family)